MKEIAFARQARCDTMIKFSNTHKCEFCSTVFEWKYIKLEPGDVIVHRIDDAMKNVKNVNKTEFQYIIELQCPNPNCLRRHFVEIDK